MLRSPVAAHKQLRPSLRTGLSLACPDWFLRQPRQGHRSWPSSSVEPLSFHCRPLCLCSPTRCADPFCLSAPEPDHRVQPRCDDLRLTASVPHPYRLPVLGCYPPDGLTLPEAPHGQDLPPEPARFPFAPRQASLSICSLDRRSRFATVPEAYCSSDLLEPPPLYACAQTVSNVFCISQGVYAQLYLI